MARKKLSRKTLSVRVSPETQAKLKEMALSTGFEYDGEGGTGAFLDAIAQGDFILIKK